MAVTPVIYYIQLDTGFDEIPPTVKFSIKRIGGKIISSSPLQIKAKFGSLFKSRFLGELIVSNDTLPRKTIIDLNQNKNEIMITVVHTHKMGAMFMYEDKYMETLNMTADNIMQIIYQSLGNY